MSGYGRERGNEWSKDDDNLDDDWQPCGPGFYAQQVAGYARPLSGFAIADRFTHARLCRGDKVSLSTLRCCSGRCSSLFSNRRCVAPSQLSTFIALCVRAWSSLKLNTQWCFQQTEFDGKGTLPLPFSPFDANDAVEISNQVRVRILQRIVERGLIRGWWNFTSHASLRHEHAGTTRKNRFSVDEWWAFWPGVIKQTRQRGPFRWTFGSMSNSCGSSGARNCVT